MTRLRIRRAREIADDLSAADDRDADSSKRDVNWRRILVYGLFPGLALILALTAGYLKWEDSSVRVADVSATESLQAAMDSTIALLSYKPDTVERDLGAARDRTTGAFRDSYTELTDEVVIPGSKEKRITAAVSIPAASSVSATESQAVVLVFVNQTVSMGNEAPTDSVSSVRVTLDRIGDRWLVSGFDPV